jgi:transcriptional regulator GlxA family with amidase domain
LFGLGISARRRRRQRGRAPHGGAPHRDGGQAQFVPAQVDEADDPANLAALHQWTLEHLGEPITVADLAAHALMSPRTFARQFAARTGTTPHQWLTRARLMRAQELLEQSGDSIEQIAAGCGLSPLMLRRHFSRTWGTTPQAYRRTSGRAEPEPGPVLAATS